MNAIAEDRDAGRLQSSWYAIQECVRSALSSIRAHGLRSSLTMLGIVIGVASVICVIALVQGLSESISSQLQGLGGSTLTLRSYTPLEDQMRGKRNRLRLQDLDELRHRIDGISNITPIVFAGGGMNSQRAHELVQAYAVNRPLGELFPLALDVLDARYNGVEAGE